MSIIDLSLRQDLPQYVIPDRKPTKRKLTGTTDIDYEPPSKRSTMYCHSLVHSLADQLVLLIKVTRIMLVKGHLQREVLHHPSKTKYLKNYVLLMMIMLQTSQKNRIQRKMTKQKVLLTNLDPVMMMVHS